MQRERLTIGDTLPCPSANGQRPRDVLNDAVTAERMFAAVGDQVIFCQPLKRFFVWTGKVWQPDETHEVHKFAKTAAQSFYADAAAAKAAAQGKEAKALRRHAEKAETHRGILDTLGSFKVLPGVSVLPDELDTAAIVNFQNGRLDLETLEFKAGHNPQDRLTKILPYDLNEWADCPRWVSFLEEIMEGDAARIQYLQRLAGYCLTPFTSEQFLWIFFGAGANGKSTFLNVLLRLFGSYARQLDPTLLITRNNDAHPCGVAALKGLRLGVCQEIESGRRMAEATVKQLTGGDRISARYINADWFDFDPTAKLILGTNHKPIIGGTDVGIWRRIRLIPFSATIPPERQDKDLFKKLCDEGEGILAWAVDGLRQWRDKGFNHVRAIDDATSEYRADMDVFDHFLDDACTVGDFAETRFADLRRAYEEWCQANGHRAIGGNNFTNALKERGFTNRKGPKGARIWTGVGLQAPDGWEAHP